MELKKKKKKIPQACSAAISKTREDPRHVLSESSARRNRDSSVNVARMQKVCVTRAASGTAGFTPSCRPSKRGRTRRRFADRLHVNTLCDLFAIFLADRCRFERLSPPLSAIEPVESSTLPT